MHALNAAQQAEIVAKLSMSRNTVALLLDTGAAAVWRLPYPAGWIGSDQVGVGAGAEVIAVGGIAVGEEAPDVGAGAGGVVGSVVGAPVGDTPVGRVGVVDTW